MKKEVRRKTFAPRSMVIAGAVLASALASILIVSATSLQPPCSDFTNSACHPVPPVLTNKATQTVTGDVNVTGKLCAGSGTSQVCMPSSGSSTGSSSVSAGNLTMLKTPVVIGGDSVGANYVRLVGGATYAPGKIGNAFSLNGTTARVEVADSPSQYVQKFTFSLWVYPTSNPTDSRFLINKEQYGGGGPFRLLRTSNGGIYANVEDFGSSGWCGGIWTTPGNVVPLNQWTHIGWTYAGNTGSTADTQVYINGVAQPTTFTQDYTYSCFSPIYGATNNGYVIPLEIGASDSQSGPLQGLIDDIRLYNRPLSSSEVSGISAGSPPPTSGLVSSWTGDTENLDEFNAKTFNVRQLVQNATGTDPGPISVAILRATVNNGAGIASGGTYAFNGGSGLSNGPTYFATPADSSEDFSKYATISKYALNRSSSIQSWQGSTGGFINGETTTTLVPLDANSQMKAGFWRGGYYCTTTYDTGGGSPSGYCYPSYATYSSNYPGASPSKGGELSIVGYYK